WVEAFKRANPYTVAVRYFGKRVARAYLVLYHAASGGRFGCAATASTATSPPLQGAAVVVE
nr:hypothetical protein [Tanacetum cinerariifolium]